MFEFNISLSEDELFQINRSFILKYITIKKYWFVLLIMTIVVNYTIIEDFIFINSVLFTDILFAVLLMLPSVLMLLFGRKLLIFVIDKLTKKMIRNNMRLCANEFTLDFAEENFCERSAYYQYKVKYSFIQNIIETEKGIFIEDSSLFGYIIPITAFTGQAEKSRFLEFINSKAVNIKK